MSSRFHRLQETTAALRPFVSIQRTAIERGAEIAERHVDQHRIAASRDYAFPLYPEAMIRDFFARQMAAIDPSVI